MKKNRLAKLGIFLALAAGFFLPPSGAVIAACPDNMIGFWKLDETNPGNGYKDEVLDNAGTGEGELSSAAGIIENAVGFDGSTAKINIPPNRTYNWLGTDSFTIELWVYKDLAVATENEVMIGRFDDPLDMLWWVGVDKNSGNAVFFLDDDIDDGDENWTKLIGNTRIDDGKWHHIVGVRDAVSNTNFLYVDGVSHNSDEREFPDGLTSPTGPLSLGGLDVGATSFGYAGLIDEVALYDRALSAQEIELHYDEGQNGDDYCGGVKPAEPNDAPFPDDTISLWHLDEASGSATYVDIFGGNDGKVGTEQNPTVAVSGLVGGAQQFTNTSGNETAIDVPSDRSFNWLGNDSFSVEAWVKKDSPAEISNEVMVGRFDTSTLWWIGIDQDTGNAVFFLDDDFSDGSDTWTKIVGTTELTDGSWHHVVGVRDHADGESLLYVDGEMQGSDSRLLENGFSSVKSDLNMGWLETDSDTYRFNGVLDEVALYGRALPLEEIIAHRDAGLAGKDVTSLKPPPTADAGPDQTDVNKDDTVTLDGSGSSPGYSGTTITSYLWEQISGTAVTITDAGSATASFTAPDVGSSEEALTFTLTVTDGNNASAVDETIVMVSPTTSGGGGGSSDCFIGTIF